MAPMGTNPERVWVSVFSLFSLPFLLKAQRSQERGGSWEPTHIPACQPVPCWETRLVDCFQTAGKMSNCHPWFKWDFPKASKYFRIQDLIPLAENKSKQNSLNRGIMGPGFRAGVPLGVAMVESGRLGLCCILFAASNRSSEPFSPNIDAWVHMHRPDAPPGCV